jgi:hypothetical protein
MPIDEQANIARIMEAFFATICCEFDKNSAPILSNIDQRIYFSYTGWCLEFTKTNELADM